MNEQELRAAVQRVLLTELARAGEAFVPVVSSNRHCHLSQRDVEQLFGPGYQLTKMRELVQPGQFACRERVTIETERGRLTLRVVGPARQETQVELSLTDAVKLGLKPPVRMSGQLEDSPGCTLTNGERRLVLARGVIVAARHLHLAPEEAEAFGLRDGDTVSLKAEGQRGATLENVVVRSGRAHRLEAHIDRDEANACGLTDGRLCRVLRPGAAAPVPPSSRPETRPAAEPAPPRRETMLDLSGEPRCLITEEDVLRAAAEGRSIIRYGKDAILTPLARDAASDKRIQLARLV